MRNSRSSRSVSAIALSLLLIPAAGFAGGNLPVGHVAFRDQVVTIAVGQVGVLYTVSTLDGDLVDAELTESELLARHPDLYGLLESAIAAPASWAGSDIRTPARFPSDAP